MVLMNLVLALWMSWFAPANTMSVMQSTCDAKQYKDKAIKAIPEGFTFLKSYTVDGKGGNTRKVEYSYIFSKNTNYIVLLDNGNAQTKGFTFTLYDSNRRQLATSLARNKYYSAVSYKCNATGIYYLVFQFDGQASSYCAGAVLGFKR